MRVLTGLDLPWGSPGGSVELLRDLYLDPDGPLGASDVFMLAPDGGPVPTPDPTPTLLDVPGKQLDGRGFWSYVGRLTEELTLRFAPGDHDVLHLQHLAFGATPALLRAFPKHPGIALVHGTDLLFAAEHPTQADVLREATTAARAVVVPTAAMADQLRLLTPVESGRVVHIPWGVPDRLLHRPPVRPVRDDGDLRVLYAGRLTAEKGASQLVSALAGTPGLTLSMAAPAAEFRRLAEVVDLSTTRYLGWLSRPALWAAFAEHDLLVIPSAKLEAFGLTAIEAQACGLPVAYQPVPGLIDALGDSALPLDVLADPHRARATLTGLASDRSALEDLRAAGRSNAARYPLSETARGLASLSARLA
ncbi:glycosyltransferase family 4 protein [Streptomyces sp. NPDC029216]|uniref:glycosyltransferase family 4 protein n=1 Tax=Streptomyces sp. NPDC029216 TaxID=3154701 RepID=UPI0033DBCB1D